jgi:haloalkane dehalogenase
VTHNGDKIFLREVPGTQGQPHVTIEGAGHFLQEDAHAQLVAIINEFTASR